MIRLIISDYDKCVLSFVFLPFWGKGERNDLSFLLLYDISNGCGKTRVVYVLFWSNLVCLSQTTSKKLPVDF